MATKSIGSAGRDYATIADWVASLPGTLTENEIGELYNDSLFTISGPIQITGITVGAFTITLRPAAGQGFKDYAASNPAFKFQYDQAQGAAIFCSDGLYNPAIIATQGGLTIQGIQLKTTASSTNLLTLTSGAVARDCILDGAYNGSAIQLDSSSSTKLINCLCVQRHASFTGVFILLQSSAQAINCTVVKPSGVAASGKGMQANYGGLAKNCIVMGFSTSFHTSGWDGGSDYNLADDANAPGANSQQSKTYANQFVSGTDNWSLKAGADAIDHGNTDATNAPTDVVGKTRPATTLGDIGAREYFVVVTVTPTQAEMIFASVSPTAIRLSSIALGNLTPADLFFGRAGPTILPDGFTPAAASMVMATVNPTVVQNNITLSNLTAASMILSASLSGILTEGGTRVVPNPADLYFASVNPTVLGGAVILNNLTPASFIFSVPANPIVDLGSLNFIPNVGLGIPYMILSSQAGFFLGGFVNLLWDASLQGNPTGYKLWYGAASANYDGQGAIYNGQVRNSPIDVGLNLAATLRNLPSQQNWYFAVTAYNALGESGYSNELVIFVTTGLFITPSVREMILAAVDPAVRLGSIAPVTTPASMVLSTVNPVVQSTGALTIPPVQAEFVLSTGNPNVVQTSQTISSGLRAEMVFGNANPTVDVTGLLAVFPAAASMVFGNVDPLVKMGNILLQMDALGKRAEMILASLDPNTFTGGLVLSPTSGEMYFGSVDPAIKFGNLLMPAAGEMFFAAVDPVVEFGSVTVAPSRAEMIFENKGPKRIGVSVGALASPSTAGDDVVVMYPRRHGKRGF